MRAMGSNKQEMEMHLQAQPNVGKLEDTEGCPLLVVAVAKQCQQAMLLGAKQKTSYRE